MSGRMEIMEGPVQLPGTLALHEERLVSLWDRLVTRLGIHTVRVLLDRAIWQTAQRHPDIALIHHDAAGFTFDAMERSYATRPQEEIEAAFDDLSAELLLIVARLLGGRRDGASAQTTRARVRPERDLEVTP
jgi:hypothetical protein